MAKPLAGGYVQPCDPPYRVLVGRPALDARPAPEGGTSHQQGQSMRLIRSITLICVAALSLALSGCASPEMSRSEAREHFLEMNCRASTAALTILVSQLDGDLTRIVDGAKKASDAYRQLSSSLRDTSDWPEEIEFDIGRIADDIDENVVPTMDALALARSLETAKSVSNDGQMVAKGSETDRVLDYLGLDPLVLECN